ncbi:MAG: TolB family protein [Acidimicrobiia bacterium]
MTGKRTIAAVAALGLMALLPLTRAQGAAGIEGNGDSTTSCSSLSPGACTRRAISTDGSRVVFTSKATNLVDGDDNDQADIFLATVAADGTHVVERISLPDPASGGSGPEADDDSGTATISPSGEWVAFESEATNLVGGDTNDVTDLFLYHVPGKRLTRVSVPDETTGLAQANLRSFGPSVADDGSVAFTSFATNLVASGTPQFQAVYVRRTNPAGTFLATADADGPSRQASISADGTKVAFISAANLDAGEIPNHEDDVFVYTVGAGLTRVTADAGAEEPSLRPDGASVAFVSDSDQFDADGLADVVVMAVGGGDIKVLGDCACDPSLDRSAHAPFLIAGDLVAFQSGAPLAAPVASDQVWLRDASAAIALVSQSPGGPLPNGSSRYISLSGEGSRAVFTSAASNLVLDDDNGRTDVFLRQLPGGALVRLSQRPASTPAPTTPPTTPATTPPTAPPTITPFEAPPAEVPTAEPSYVGVTRTGYWMLDGDGNVYGFGTAKVLGSPVKELGNTHASDIEPTPSGDGYWIVDRRGRVYTYGDATHYGNADRANFTKDEKVTSISATITGRGYWIFTTSGRVLAQGDAVHHGDLSAVKLNGPVLDSIPTATGRGYYMVASDGGIFTFGDARFHGSLGSFKLNAPVQSLVPDGDGVGYWLVAADGGAFTFETPFRGSMGGKPLNKPMTGMIPFGNGYLMVAEDGGIFNFSNLPFLGSLGDHPPVEPVVAVAAR